MEFTNRLIAMSVSTVLLAGCAGNPQVAAACNHPNYDTAATVGGVAGGVLGSTIGRGVAFDQDEITVKTIARTPRKQPFAIDYLTNRKLDSRKGTDVLVENLSLVLNYRGTFTEDINHSGIDGLIQELEQKNRVIANS